MSISFRFLMVTLASAAVIWFCGGFVLMDWDIASWSRDSRAALIVLAVVAGATYGAMDI